MAITDTQIDNAIPEYGDTTPHPTQPNQSLINQLLKMVRDEVAAALTADNLQQNVGISTTTAMSQKAVTDELQTKLTAGDLVQVTGQSTTDVMSQKAVTDHLLGIGQTWQDVTRQRSSSTVYTNTTGKVIAVAVSGPLQTSGVKSQIQAYIDGVYVARSSVGPASYGDGVNAFLFFLVPPGATYYVPLVGRGDIHNWSELR